MSELNDTNSIIINEERIPLPTVRVILQDISEENQALKAEVERLKLGLKTSLDTGKGLLACSKGLEAQLTKAMEGLEVIVGMAHNIALNEEKEGRFLGGLTKGCYSIKGKAEQTLKDIKGGSDGVSDEES